MKTKLSLKAGDILISKGGSKTKVLAVIGDVFARSCWERYDCFSEWLTIEEAMRCDYRKEWKGRYRMTVEEAEAMLGVKIIKE